MKAQGNPAHACPLAILERRRDESPLPAGEAMAWRSARDCPCWGVHLSTQLWSIAPAGPQSEAAAPDLPDGEARAVENHGRGTWALVKKFICF